MSEPIRVQRYDVEQTSDGRDVAIRNDVGDWYKVSDIDPLLKELESAREALKMMSAPVLENLAICAAQIEREKVYLANVGFKPGDRRVTAEEVLASLRPYFPKSDFTPPSANEETQP